MAGELTSEPAERTERNLEARRLIVEAGAAETRPTQGWGFGIALVVAGAIGAGCVGVAAAVLWHA